MEAIATISGELLEMCVKVIAVFVITLVILLKL